MGTLYIYKGSKKFLEECKFWSNAAGGLHYHGEYQMKEKDLPDPLKRAYRDLFTERSGFHCHLAEFRGKFGIALSNEFGAEFHEALGLTTAEYQETIRIKAAEILNKVESMDCVVLVVWYGKKPYSEAKILVFMPWYIQRTDFDRIASLLEKEIYELDHPKIKLEDAEVLRIYDNRVNDSEIQDAIEQNLDIIGCVGAELLADNENESSKLLGFYQRGSDLVKASVDTTLIYLCGYDLKSIISRAEPQE